MAQNSILRDKYLDTQHVYAGSGADTSPSYTFSSALSTGIYINTEGSVATSIGGTGRFIIGSTQVSTNAPLRISNTTASTSATTGALVVSGSVGVAGSLNLGSSLSWQRVFGSVIGIGGQSISNVTETVLSTYWSGTQVLENGITFGSGQFTVPRVGKYLVTISVSFTFNPTGVRSLFATINNSTAATPRYGYAMITATPSDRAGVVTSTVLNITAINGTSNKISAIVYQTSGGILGMDNNVNGYFTISEL